MPVGTELNRPTSDNDRPARASPRHLAPACPPMCRRAGLAHSRHGSPRPGSVTYRSHRANNHCKNIDVSDRDRVGCNAIGEPQNRARRASDLERQRSSSMRTMFCSSEPSQAKPQPVNDGRHLLFGPVSMESCASIHKMTGCTSRRVIERNRTCPPRAASIKKSAEIGDWGHQGGPHDGFASFSRS